MKFNSEMKLNPYLEVIIAATFGGFAAALIKLLGLPSTSACFFRFAVPVLLLVLYFWYKGTNPFRGNYKTMMITSALSAARLFCFITSYIYTSVSSATIIFFTWPIFAALMGIFYYKERVNVKTMFLFGLAFAGIILMYIHKEVSLTNLDFIGMTLMIISAILYAVTIVIFKNQLEYYTKSETIFYQNLVGAVVFIPFIFINTPAPDLRQIGLAVFYAAIAGICTFYFFFSALKKMKVSHYSLLTYWEVPSAIFFAWLLFRESITLNMVIGGILIIISGFLLRNAETR